MTIFWILAAGIAFLAVLFVIAPLLRPDTPDDDIDQDQVNLALFKQQLAELDADLAAGKLDQAQYDSARRDIEREVLYDVGGQAATTGAKPMLPGPRATLLALLLAVPVSALVLYLALGERQIIPQLAAGAVGASATGHAGSGMPPLEDLVARLEQRMQQVPDDAEGWTMLGRTYFATGQTDKAEQALARAYELMPKDATVLLAYAESIAANQGNDLAGRPADLIGEALAADPDNATARWLSGMVAYQHGQFSAAAVAWKKALAQLDPDSDDARELQQLIEQAEQRAGVPPEQRQLAQASGTAAEQASGTAAAGMGDKAPAGDAAAAAPEPPASARAAEPAAAADSGAQISVQVSLDPALADRAAPDTTVFVYAKAPAGPPMPLAVQRVTVADLPATLTLDDSMAMMPAMKLSGFPQVIVGARVSASGQAMPRPGDLEGETGPISSSSVDPVEVRIDSVRP